MECPAKNKIKNNIVKKINAYVISVWNDTDTVEFFVPDSFFTPNYYESITLHDTGCFKFTKFGSLLRNTEEHHWLYL